MSAGRPRTANREFLYTVAQLFYWDFRKLAEGGARLLPDEKKYRELVDGLETRSFLDDEDRVRHRELVDAEIGEGHLDHFQRKKDSAT